MKFVYDELSAGHYPWLQNQLPLALLNEGNRPIEAGDNLRNGFLRGRR